MIRLSFPSIEEDDLLVVRSVLESGYLVQGRNVAAFEKAAAEQTGSRHAVAVSSCTAALHLSLLSLDVKQGDIILLPAYSWIATANVVELCHARPYFVDILPDTFNIDPNGIRTSLNKLMADSTVARKVKAILPVHCFGQVADMPKIMEIAGEYDLDVIEDAACALGASLNGKQAGKWGATGCFSFHPRKAVTTGEGGVITTDDKELADRLRSLRNHGISTSDDQTDFIMPGFNYRMTDFQGALGVTQVSKLKRIISSRRQKAAIYDALLKDTSIQAPKVSATGEPVYQSYVILLPEGASGNMRSSLINYLWEQEIETTIGTINMPMTSYFKKHYAFNKGMFPVTDNISTRSLSLPLHEKLTDDDQRFIISHLSKGLERYFS